MQSVKECSHLVLLGETHLDLSSSFCIRGMIAAGCTCKGGVSESMTEKEEVVIHVTDYKPTERYKRCVMCKVYAIGGNMNCVRILSDVFMKK